MSVSERSVTKFELVVLTILTVLVCWWLSAELSNDVFLVFTYVLGLLIWAQVRGD